MDSFLTDLLFNGNSPSLLCALVANLTVLYATTNLEIDKKYRPNLKGWPDEEYDYIIVGSGSAGGIVASRLAEYEKISVLLLEAGGDPLPINDIPFLWVNNIGHSETDWMFSTVPQKYGAKAYINNTIPQPRGKSLGGTSNLNAMVYLRGNRLDYDNWAELTKDEEWSYAKLLPFFKKLEDYDGSFETESGHHGNSGPIHVSRQTLPALKDEWIAAGRELGFPFADPDANQTSSFVPVDVSGLKGVRWEVYKGYLKEAERRKNLKILRYAQVTKISLNEQNNSAVSVTYSRHGEIFTVKARNEIILSAGAFNTPQLLMLSGIGPAAHLKSVGIETKVDLPGVGENYLDHVASTIGPFLLNDSVSFIQNRDINFTAAVDYIMDGKGPYGWNLIQGHGLYSTSGNPDYWPNIIYHHMPIGGNGCSLLGPLKEGICEKYMDGVDEHQDLMWAIMFLGRNPKSTGTVRLRSSNPMDTPLIDPNIFSDERDVKELLEGFRFLITVYEETDAFKKYNASLIRNKFPGCEEFQHKSDEYYECYLRQVTRTMYHPTSTCKMGSDDDSMTVVDSKLRVRGVSKLRVADASIMPDIPNVNINAATMMIGEKAADIILRDWFSKNVTRDKYKYFSRRLFRFLSCVTLLLVLSWVLKNYFHKTTASQVRQKN